jgi:hypothetical protein
MRQNYSKAIEDRLDCIKTGCHSKDTTSKRRISRFILLFDVVLIIVIFFYFYNTQKETPITSGTVTKSGVEYRVTATLYDDAYIFLVQITGSEESNAIEFDGYVADLLIYYNDRKIMNEKIAPKKG